MSHPNASIRATPWIVIAVIALGEFMALLDLTIVNIAIPSILDGLRASLDDVLWVLNAYSLVFARLGLFLPLTIFYQSVLGLSAQDAGITVAAQPLVMMGSSAIAASLADRYAKWLLIPGLTLFAAGTAYIDLVASAGAGRWTFLPALIGNGVGLGFVWMPVYGLATRDLQPQLAGVGTGVLSTIQELGGVIASAAVSCFAVRSRAGGQDASARSPSEDAVA